ncbi:RibD family protein [Marinicauda algicola]|uniref:RibD family protein n=1 Tax=Marinicauda algicola TaxID=2029849 RepID=A0A4S2GXF3_9PROT|nr:RibD family protein [Marinicauda algicola]TGY87860.1 RibD family protein [Marinicauda algicola]
MEVVLKLATSLDGRIALANGESRWITSEEARAEVHRLRSQADAILTGRGTVEADDPRMDVRDVEGFHGPQPAVAVLDTHCRVRPQARIFAAGRERFVFCRGDAPGARAEALRSAGVEVVACPGEAGVVSIDAALSELDGRGFACVLIEAGAAVAASALRARGLTRIEWFRAPIVLGGDARPVFTGLGLESLASAPRFVRAGVRECGPDIHETYELDR